MLARNFLTFLPTQYQCQYRCIREIQAEPKTWGKKGGAVARGRIGFEDLLLHAYVLPAYLHF
jgi:hypothetical protein